MYWNSSPWPFLLPWQRLIETWDVLKSYPVNVAVFAVPINRNMRCIEIKRCKDRLLYALWLIETWDVLKSEQTENVHVRTSINRNMRCIEIPIFFGLHQHLPRLIETWDVLKLARVFFWQEVHAGLIETWDVLK